jgi:hypothetical protein
MRQAGEGESVGDFSKLEAMPITLSDDEFALLYEYLDREHSSVWDPETVGKTTKIGKRLWDRIQDVAVEQGLHTHP